MSKVRINVNIYVMSRRCRTLKIEVQSNSDFK